MKANFFVIFVCLMASIAMVGCLGGSSSDDVAAATGTIKGKVIDSAGAAVAAATVTDGSKTATTDGSGNFTLEGVTAGAQVKLTVSKASYLNTYAFEPLSGGQTALATYTMRAVSAADKATLTLNTATAADRTITKSATIEFAQNSILKADGTPATTAEVTVVHTKPSTTKALETFPGTFEGYALVNATSQTTSTTATPIETFGYVYVDLGTGNKLDSTKPATITIPIDAGATNDLEMPLWHYDTTDGKWKQVGTATRAVNTAPFTAQVTHFSWYNLDKPVSVRQLEVTVASYTSTSYPHGDIGTTSTTDTNKTDLTKRIANARVTVKASLETGTDTDNSFNTSSNTGTWQEVKVTNTSGIATFNIPQGRRIMIEVTTPDKTTQGYGYTVENGVAKAFVNMGSSWY